MLHFGNVVFKILLVFFGTSKCQSLFSTLRFPLLDLNRLLNPFGFSNLNANNYWQHQYPYNQQQYPYNPYYYPYYQQSDLINNQFYNYNPWNPYPNLEFRNNLMFLKRPKPTKSLSEPILSSTPNKVEEEVNTEASLEPQMDVQLSQTTTPLNDPSNPNNIITETRASVKAHKIYKNCKVHANQTKIDECFYKKMEQYFQFLGRLIFPREIYEIR